MKPHWIAPELASLTTHYFSDKEWIYEEKFDGIRCIAICQKGKVSLYSRNHNLINGAFPEIVEALEKSAKTDFVIDGEIVTLDKGISNFSKLQNRFGILNLSRLKGERSPVTFFVFDMLFWKDTSLIKVPLLERKKMLKEHLSFNKKIRYTKHIKEKGLEYYKRACKQGYEGIIAKRAASLYYSKRTRDWLKFKCSKGQELVIGGYTEPQGSRIGFGALLVGYFDKKEFKYAGKVGTGYDFELLEKLSAKLKRLETKRCPFAHPPREKNAHYVRPTLVCEVDFTEWTKDGKLRHPRFKGLRNDKSAKSVTRERSR